MAWEPEKFTREQRLAAASAIVQAQIALYQLRLRSAEFGREHTAAVKDAYRKAESLLSMIYEDLHGFDEQIPQPPSAS